MVRPFNPALQFRIRNLERQLHVLRHCASSTSKSVLPSRSRARRQIRELIDLPGGFRATTLQGSLYTTMLVALARAGRLDRHDVLFGTFAANPTVEAAKKLLLEIAVAKNYVITMVREDRAFQEHCDRRTHLLHTRAAMGDRKALKVLDNRDIVGPDGLWHGDVEEAIRILYTGRRRTGLESRNVLIIKKAGLMFDRLVIGSTEYIVLYPQRHYRLFQQVKALSDQLESL